MLITHWTCRQIAGSDVILLNKVDLATQEQLVETEELIRQVNPASSVYKTTRGDIDLGLIMGISAYNSPPQFQSSTYAPTHNHDDCEDDGHAHTHEKEPTHYELRGISSLQVSCPVLDQSRFDRLDEWIRTVLWENHIPGDSEDQGLQVLRCKGLITLKSGEQYVLQGVRNLYEMAKVGGQVDMGIPEPGKIVLIGKGLDDGVRHSLVKAIA